MNYRLEMNYHKDIVDNVLCFTLSIGANNKEEFKWIVDNLMDFKTESVCYYYTILKNLLLQTKKNLYVINREENKIECFDLNKMNAPEALSFFKK